MSASICWRPGQYGKSLGVWAPSRFISMLEEAFGQLPVKLDASDKPLLNGMRIALEERERNAIEELIEAIDKHTEIEVMAHY